MERVEKKLREATVLVEQANVAYDDYDRALRQAQGGVATVHPNSRGAGGQHGAVDLSAAHQKPLLIHAIRGKKDEEGKGVAGLGDDLVQHPSGNEPIKTKITGPKFPLKFKMKVPGQEKSSHFNFLQSWTVHKKYYQTSEEAPNE